MTAKLRPAATPAVATGWPERITAALRKPRGARFYRCALQVNPFPYLVRHSVPTTFKDDSSYNAAVITACKLHGIEVIGVTDHYRIKTAESLIDAARTAGLHVFPGFEASTKDGVHFLCLFEPDRPLAEIERLIGDCGIHDDEDPSPIGRHDAVELIEECHKRWDGVCVAAHVASKSGLLATLKGKPGINAWKNDKLLACSLPGAASEAPEEHRLTLLNKNAEYRRESAVAVLNCHDVSDPKDFEKPAASCWIKMTEVTCEALRQAFLDPDSRVRLASDPLPVDHTEFLAVTWEGGFLDGAAIHFSENLNAFVGGRGTGKSTAIESIRYVLGKTPFGEQATQQHKDFVKHVLRNGTKISLLVRSHYPSSREYLIERTVPNAPIVRDSATGVTTLTPDDVLPETEVFGQHEISELTRSPEKLTLLLHRFIERDVTLDSRKDTARRKLETTRTDITRLERELERTTSKLDALPALEEKLKRYRELGLEEKLKERSHLVKEKQTLEQAEGLLTPIVECAESLGRELPLDTAFLHDEDVAKLPGSPTLKKAEPVLAAFNAAAEAAVRALRDAEATATAGLTGVRNEWTLRKNAVEQDYQKILRDLQKENIDGEEFIQVQESIIALKPLKASKVELSKQYNAALDKRRAAVAAWEDLKAEEFRGLEKAAKKVSRQLVGRVQVNVAYGGNREPLRAHLKKLSGRTAELVQLLMTKDSLSLSDVATKARSGRDGFLTTYSVPAAQAEALCGCGTDFLLQLEELDLPATTTIQLNVAAEGNPAVWKALAELSTGQKATAVLLLLLLESDGPLVVDQPEDDLDNRFITEGVVPAMRREKRRRQFVFATHNANIPVLGDAELIVALSATGEAEGGRAEILDENTGSIDSKTIQRVVEEILEGGKAAFETRRRKYGF